LPSQAGAGKILAGARRLIDSAEVRCDGGGEPGDWRRGSMGDRAESGGLDPRGITCFASPSWALGSDKQAAKHRMLTYAVNGR